LATSLVQVGVKMVDYKTWLVKHHEELHSQLEKVQSEVFSIAAKELTKKIFVESSQTSRYSISVDYRTNKEDVMEAFAKLVLGYVSAGLKKMGLHTKHVFEEKPLRLLVSSRNWDDGEWTGVISWSDKEKCFLISKGFYNKERKTISVQSTKKCADNASEIAKEVKNMMHHLKDQPDRHQEKLKPVNLKRGPK